MLLERLLHLLRPTEERPRLLERAEGVELLRGCLPLQPDVGVRGLLPAGQRAGRRVRSGPGVHQSLVDSWN